MPGVRPACAAHGPGHRSPCSPPRCTSGTGPDLGWGCPAQPWQHGGYRETPPLPPQHAWAAGQVLSHPAVSLAHPAWLIPKAPLSIGPHRLAPARCCKADCRDGDGEQARHRVHQHPAFQHISVPPRATRCAAAWDRPPNPFAAAAMAELSPLPRDAGHAGARHGQRWLGTMAALCGVLETAGPGTARDKPAPAPQHPEAAAPSARHRCPTASPCSRGRALSQAGTAEHPHGSLAAIGDSS